MDENKVAAEKFREIAVAYQVPCLLRWLEIAWACACAASFAILHPLVSFKD